MKRRKRFLVIIMALIWMFPGQVMASEAAKETKEIVIYHTNDMHGAVVYEEDGSIGLDHVAAMKKQTPNAILADAGDATQGLPYASLTQGADIMELMNAAGYDVMAAGNHEFDFGTEKFLQNVSLADFPVLAANIYRNGVPLLEEQENNGCHTIIERDGIKVGFFGLTTAATATSTNPEGIKGLEFKDELETAKQEIDALTEEGADVIVAIVHLGIYTNVPWDSNSLAEAMTGEYAGKLDVIIDGHSHTVSSDFVNNVLVMQTGTGLKNLGKVVIGFDEEGILDSIEGEILLAEEVTEAVEPEEEVQSQINSVVERMMADLSNVIGSSESVLWGGTIDGVAEARVVETNLGDLAADAYKDAAESFLKEAKGMENYQGLPVIAAENGGGIRASIPKGEVTKGDFIKIFPFSNTLMIKEITPKILFGLLENSVSAIYGQDKETGLLTADANGGFLQVSGIRFTYDPEKEQGGKVLSVVLEATGEELDRTDEKTRLLFVSNNFIMSGGNDYTVLAELPMVGEIGGELETVENYFLKITEGKELPAQTVQGRITIEGGYAPKDYTAYISIVNADGTTAANTPVTYYVDQDEPKEGVTDEAGMLSIVVSDGPHCVSLWEKQKSVYINNYTGAGIVENEYRGFPVLELPDAEEAQDLTAEQMEEETEGTERTEVEESAEIAPIQEGKDSSIVVVGIVIAVFVLALAVVVCRKKKQ